MKSTKAPSLFQRMAMVGGGLALVAGATAVAKRSRLQEAVGKWLGNAAQRGKAFVDAGAVRPPLFQQRPSDVAACDVIWSKPGDATANERAVNVVMTISRSELKEALKAAFPLRIQLSSEEDTWIEVAALESLNYQPGRGVLLRCAARVNYPIPVLPDRYLLEELTVLVTPTIVDGERGPVMAFKLDITDVDVKYLPDFVDAAIAARINKTLRDKVAKIAWDFQATIDRVLSLPPRVSELRQIALGPTRASVEIADDGLVVRFAVPLSFRHEPAPEVN